MDQPKIGGIGKAFHVTPAGCPSIEGVTRRGFREGQSRGESSLALDLSRALIVPSDRSSRQGTVPMIRNDLFQAKGDNKSYTGFFGSRTFFCSCLFAVIATRCATAGAYCAG
jgi:hypothetical protein